MNSSDDQGRSAGEPWHIDWDSCCTRCHALMNWEGDPPEGEDDALCNDCVWREVDERRTQVETLTRERDNALKVIEQTARERDEARGWREDVMIQACGMACRDAPPIIVGPDGMSVPVEDYNERAREAWVNAGALHLATKEAAQLRATLEDRDADKRLSVALAQEVERLRAELAEARRDEREQTIEQALGFVRVLVQLSGCDAAAGDRIAEGVKLGLSLPRANAEQRHRKSGE